MHEPTDLGARFRARGQDLPKQCRIHDPFIFVKRTTALTSAARYSPRNNPKHVSDALSQLRDDLFPFIENRMRAVYGDRWRDQARALLKKNVPSDFERDKSNLFNLLRSDDQVFVALGADAKTLGSKLITARNQSHHHDEMDLDDTVYAIDTICKTYALIGLVVPEGIERHQYELRRLFVDSIQSEHGNEKGNSKSPWPTKSQETQSNPSERKTAEHSTSALQAPANQTPAQTGVSDVLRPASNSRSLLVATTVILLLSIPLVRWLASGPADPLVTQLTESKAVQSGAGASGERTHAEPTKETGVSAVPIKPPVPVREMPQSPSAEPGSNGEKRGAVEPRAVDGAESAVLSPPKRPALGMKEASDAFLFELEECSASGRTASCLLFVTNQDGVRPLMILHSARNLDGSSGSAAAFVANLAGTRAIDDLGTQAVMREAKLANYGTFGGDLVEGIRTRLVVTLEGLDEKASKLVVFDVASQIEANRRAFNVRFREVPLVR